MATTKSSVPMNLCFYVTGHLLINPNPGSAAFYTIFQPNIQRWSGVLNHKTCLILAVYQQGPCVR